MPDIQLRLGKDMLVLSTPINSTIEKQGFDPEEDYDYVALCEPEILEELYRFEDAIGTQCIVTPTEGITAARLALSRFDGRMEDFAEVAYKAASQFRPQHLLAAIGPTGLPLDETSATSLRASRKQYQDAVAALAMHPFDAMFFSCFPDYNDAQCALMGARAVYDGPLFITFQIDSDGELAHHEHSLAEAVAMASEYGADVIGIAAAGAIERISASIDQVKASTDKPLIVELIVKEPSKVQFKVDENNPYYSADTMVDAAIKLFAKGVQFVRAAGDATPSYTGALVSTLTGLDVHNG